MDIKAEEVDIKFEVLKFGNEIKKEEIKSDSSDFQDCLIEDIKIEEEEIKSENWVTFNNEISFKEEDFWPEEKVDCDGNSLCSLSEEDHKQHMEKLLEKQMKLKAELEAVTLALKDNEISIKSSAAHTLNLSVTSIASSAGARQKSKLKESVVKASSTTQTVQSSDDILGNPKRFRPKRPCYYCSKTDRDMSYHLEKFHANEKEIEKILKLDRASRLKAMKVIRNLGIAKANKQKLAANENLIYVKSQKTEICDMVTCSNCKGLFKRSYFSYHKKKCFNDSKIPARNSGYLPPIKTIVHNEKLETKFQEQILMKLNRDKVGSYIMSNEHMYEIGYKLFRQLHVKEMTSVNNNIRQNLRSLTRIFLYFKNLVLKEKNVVVENVLLMFDCQYVSIINRVIELLVNIDNNVLYESSEFKPGMNLVFGYVIKKISLIVKDIFFDIDDKVGESKVKDFIKLFNSKWSYHLKKAEVTNIKKRNERRRAPDHLPAVDDCVKVKEYLNSTLGKFINLEKNYSIDQIYLLRRTTLCKIVFFNGRRPQEVSDLTIDDWKKARADHYVVQSDDIHETAKERELLENYKICYNQSKNAGQDISIIFPKSTWVPLDILTKMNVRGQVGINLANKYIFAAFKDSILPASSWMDVHRCCMEAKVDKAISADINRHKLATAFGMSTSLTENLQKLVLSHLGHSLKTNESWYQIYQGRRAICNVAPFLSTADENYTGARLNHLSNKSVSKDSSSTSHIVEPSAGSPSHSIMSEDEDRNSTTSSHVSDSSSTNAIISGEEDGSHLSAKTRHLKKRKFQSFERTKLTWSSYDKQLLLKHYKDFIEGKIESISDRREETVLHL